MRRQALSAAVAVALLASAVAAANPVAGDDLYDARYCEILELKGSPPNARVLVWNTIGFNDCPAAEWEAIDATAIAAERGDTAVIKNGPRHFLMDTATAQAGATHVFGGLKMRKVASIPIRTTEELAQTPYAERTIKRRNTWTWNAGRRVYELLAPDGSDYLMQSYSQVRDAELQIGDLRSLGSRLELPQGWSYRSRRLRNDLTLTADGRATVIQDDLANTYQLLPDTRETERHRVDITGQTKTVASPAPGTLHDQGTIAGPPFGSGTVDLVVTLADGNATGTFTIDSPKGAAFGTVDMTYVITGNEIDFTGEAAFTGGTGRFRGIRGEHLRAHDHNTLDGQSGSFTLEGRANY